MRSRKAETRDSSRPGSQAPNAPPALTFGLTGKQMVKAVWAGSVLIRLLSSLPRNPGILRKVNDLGHPGRPPPGHRTAQFPSGGVFLIRTTYARVSSPGRSDLAGNRRTRFPE